MANSSKGQRVKGLLFGAMESPHPGEAGTDQRARPHPNTALFTNTGNRPVPGKSYQLQAGGQVLPQISAGAPTRCQVQKVTVVFPKATRMYGWRKNVNKGPKSHVMDTGLLCGLFT